MISLKQTLQIGFKGLVGSSCHASRRSFCIQSPLLNFNKFSVGLNPWDEKVKLEGTGKEMHWPAYNERFERFENNFHLHEIFSQDISTRWRVQTSVCVSCS